MATTELTKKDGADSTEESAASKPVLPETKEGYLKLAGLMMGKQGICGESEGIRLKNAKCGVKRVDYITGPRLKQWVTENPDKLQKIGVAVTEKNDHHLVQGMVRHGIIIRAMHDKSAGRNVLQPVKQVSIKPAELDEKKCFFIWDFEGTSQSLKNVLSAMVVIICIALCLFPLWPRFAKAGLWYLSVTFLLFLTGFIIIRLILWLIFWLCGYEAWILPNVFDDDLPVNESFTPLFSFEKGGDGEGTARIVVILFIGVCGYLVATAPTSFDTYVSESKKFTFDLYEGKFLSDRSQQAKDNIDKPKFDTLEDILGFTDEPAATTSEEEAHEATVEEGETANDDLINQILQDEEEEEKDYEESKRKGEL